MPSKQLHSHSRDQFWIRHCGKRRGLGRSTYCHAWWRWATNSCFCGYSSFALVVAIQNSLVLSSLYPFGRNLFLLASWCNYLSPRARLWSFPVHIYRCFCWSTYGYFRNYQCGLLQSYRLSIILGSGCGRLGSQGWSARYMGGHHRRMVRRIASVRLCRQFGR